MRRAAAREGKGLIVDRRFRILLSIAVDRVFEGGAVRRKMSKMSKLNDHRVLRSEKFERRKRTDRVLTAAAAAVGHRHHRLRTVWCWPTWRPRGTRRSGSMCKDCVALYVRVTRALPICFASSWALLFGWPFKNRNSGESGYTGALRNKRISREPMAIPRGSQGLGEGSISLHSNNPAGLPSPSMCWNVYRSSAFRKRSNLKLESVQTLISPYPNHRLCA